MHKVFLDLNINDECQVSVSFHVFFYSSISQKHILCMKFLCFLYLALKMDNELCANILND